MKFDILDQIGNWNPQLFREIKGRLKPRNIILTLGASFLSQFLFIMFWISKIPGPYYRVTETYCLLRKKYLPYQHQLDKLYQQKNQSSQIKEQIAELQEKIPDYCPDTAINYSLWWQHHFPEMLSWLSIITIFLFLIAGTFLIINDLGREKQRGTLNFVQLSPQSSRNILLGKVLGVPILLYLGILSLFPLHLWLGLSSQISLLEMLRFYTIMIASCAFYFSVALLISLISARLNGFQAWLGSGLVFGALWVANYGLRDTEGLANWMTFFTPSLVLPLFLDHVDLTYTHLPFESGNIQNWQWFFFPIGNLEIAFTGLMLLNYGFWIYWIWQGLLRRFRNPNKTLLSKGQSYGLTLSFNLLLLGFVLQDVTFDKDYRIEENIGILTLFNIFLILIYIALLSPHRQTLMDWARYRHEDHQKKSLFKDLLWGEQSPSLGAIAFNLFLITNGVLAMNFLWIERNQFEITVAILFAVSLIFIYATITQIILMMKSKRRVIWAVSTVLALQIIPPLTLAILQVEPYDNPIPWLFSTFPWATIESIEDFQVAMTLCGHGLISLGLNLYLSRKLRLAGESELKALVSK